MIAQNTFLYFLRHNPNFDILARQVLQGYDDTCHFMSGIPTDPRALLNSETSAITFTFRSGTLPRNQEDDGPSSSGSSNLDSPRAPNLLGMSSLQRAIPPRLAVLHASPRLEGPQTSRRSSAASGLPHAEPRLQTQADLQVSPVEDLHLSGTLPRTQEDDGPSSSGSSNLDSPRSAPNLLGMSSLQRAIPQLGALSSSLLPPRAQALSSQSSAAGGSPLVGSAHSPSSFGSVLQTSPRLEMPQTSGGSSAASEFPHVEPRLQTSAHSQSISGSPSDVLHASPRLEGPQTSRGSSTASELPHAEPRLQTSAHSPSVPRPAVLHASPRLEGPQTSRGSS